MKVQANKSNPHELTTEPERCPQPGEEQLFQVGLRLLRPIAKQLWHGCGRRVELDEIVGIGLMAMVRAVRRYDPSRASFGPYLNQRLRWAMLDGIRRLTHHRRRRTTGARSALGRKGLRRRRRSREPAGDSCGELVAPPGAGRRARPWRGSAAGPGIALNLVHEASENPEELLSSRRDERSLRCAVDRLPRRERELVLGHYFQGEQFDRIAAGLNISKSRASRLHTRALRTLRRDLIRPGQLSATPA